MKTVKQAGIRAGRLVLAIIIGWGITAGALLLLQFAVTPETVRAAPFARPLAAGGTLVTHTTATTHQMSVFDDGRITNRFLNTDGQNQIDRDRLDITKTTIAVMFDQHISPTVDVGSQGEFTPTVSIALNNPSSIPGHSEDSYVVYTSGTLPYQIAQRTLATTTNNCVAVELAISNTGSITLTGGKLLFMVDIDAALFETNDDGFYDPARRLVYHLDYNDAVSSAYALGISLLDGDLRGYGSVMDTAPQYPDPFSDSELRNELNSPTNAIIDGSDNLVSWLVVNLPALPPNQATTPVFGMCANRVFNPDETAAKDEAEDGMFNEFEEWVNVSVAKTATPNGGSSVVAGNLVTYTIALSSTGSRYVDNIVLTDTIPASTDLITYSVSQGTISAGNNVITATVGRLYPASDTVTVTLVVKPPITSTTQIISNRAFIKSEPIITASNVITHQIVNEPVLAVTKSVIPSSAIEPGERLTYTIIVSSSGQGVATDIVISDTLPANTEFVTNSINLTPVDSGTKGSVPPILASNITITAGQRITLTYAVTTAAPLPNGTIITNSVAVSGTQNLIPITDTVTSSVTAITVLTMTKSAIHSVPLQPGDTITYTIVVSNSGNVDATNAVISDSLPQYTNFVTNSINLDPPGAGIKGSEPPVLAGNITIPAGQSVTVTFVVTVTNPLTNGTIIANTASVTSAQTPAPITDTATSTVTSAPILAVTKSSAHPTPLRAGHTITYTVVVSNSGNAGATGLVISDTKPANTNFVAGSIKLDPISAGIQGTVPPVLARDVTLAPGQSVTVTFAVTVTTPLSGGTSITNTVSVTSTSVPTPVTDTVSSVVAGYNPSLASFISGPDAANVGETVVYTFTIVNYANSPSFLAQFGIDVISVADALPPLGDGSPISLTLVSDDAVGSHNFVSGDGNGNGWLDGTEGWIYTAAHTFLTTVTNKVFAQGLDLDNDVVSHTSESLTTRPKFLNETYYFPIIFKN